MKKFIAQLNYIKINNILFSWFIWNSFAIVRKSINTEFPSKKTDFPLGCAEVYWKLSAAVSTAISIRFYSMKVH